MKNILIFTLNNSSPKGGSEKMWRKLAEALVARGHKVTASVYSHHREFLSANLDNRVQLRTRLPKRHGTTMISKVVHRLIGGHMEHRQLRSEIRRCKPDFIFFSFGGFAELDNPKILDSLSSLSLPYSTIFHNNTENYAFQINSISGAQKFWLKAFRNYVVSHRIAEIFQRQIGLQELNYTLAVNPMDDIQSCSIDLYQLPDSMVKMAFIGTLDISVKGIALLIQTLANCDFGETQWEMNLFGEGQDRVVIQKLIDQFGLKNRIHIQGWTDNIDEVWAKHHLLVLPSFNEGMPMVIHEAMLRKRVVVATDVGGNSEIIENKVTGFISPAATLSHLKETLETSIAAREQWANIAVKAQSAILKSRTSGHSFEDILSDIEHELH